MGNSTLILPYCYENMFIHGCKVLRNYVKGHISRQKIQKYYKLIISFVEAAICVCMLYNTENKS